MGVEFGQMPQNFEGAQQLRVLLQLQSPVKPRCFGVVWRER